MSLCNNCYNTNCTSKLRHIHCVVSCYDYINEKGESNHTMTYYTTAENDTRSKDSSLLRSNDLSAYGKKR